MVPFPIILGAVFDKACLVWEEKCGAKGSCWIYDGVFLSRGITIWIMSASVITIVLYGISLKLYKEPKPSNNNTAITMKNGRENERFDQTNEQADDYITERF